MIKPFSSVIPQGFILLACDPTLESCPTTEAVNSTSTENSTISQNQTMGFLDLTNQYGLLAVSVIQLAAGITTATDDGYSPMTFINSVFGTLGVILGIQHQFFNSQPASDCEEIGYVQDQIPVADLLVESQPCGQNLVQKYFQMIEMVEFLAGTLCLSLFVGSKSTAAYSDLTTVFNYTADLMAITFGAINILEYFQLIGDQKTGLPPTLEAVPEDTANATDNATTSQL